MRSAKAALGYPCQRIWSDSWARRLPDDYGVWSRAGSGGVHWPTEAAAAVVGLPAVWTNVRVEGDQLFYDIACSFTVEAVRLATAVAEVSRLAGPPK